MKLLVFDPIYIPGYGMGPFITPIEITDPLLLAEVRRKARVKVIEDRKLRLSKKTNSNNTYPIAIGNEAYIPVYEEELVEEEIMEEVPEEEPTMEEEIPVEEPTEEPIDELVEEPIEEVIEEEIPVEEKVLLTAEDLKDETVAELKARLDAMGVDYLYKDSKNTLIKKVIENQ